MTPTSPFFLYLLLPTTLLLHWLLPGRLRVAFLCLISLLFYGFGEGRHGIYLALTWALNYGLGLAAAGGSGWVTPATVGVNLGLLLLARAGQSLPLGVSFYTLHAMAYVFDVKRGEVAAERSPLRLGLYLSFFPQLLAGPIVRYRKFRSQLVEPRQLDLQQFASGCERLIIGLSKKLLLADPLGLRVDKIFSLPWESLSPTLVLAGGVGFMLQLYFDFSGYTDMAIGVARMLGLELRENFHYPFSARSMTHFWNRWHMSLTDWFRSYVYFPGLSGRPGRDRTVIVLTFVGIGLWHGFSLKFAFFGFLQGFLIAAERGRAGRYLRGPLYFGLCLLGSGLLFRSHDLTHWFDLCRALIGLAPGPECPARVILDAEFITLIGVGVLAAGRWGDQHWRSLTTFLRLFYLTSLAVLCELAVAGATHKEFIYFAF